jgi:hypothetical protein
MAIASGIQKVTAWKKQSALGTPATGASGKVARRVSSMFKATRDTYENNEIVTHHQSTGITLGLQNATGSLNGLLSAGTFADLIASLLEKDFAAGVVIGSQTVTYGGTAGAWTMTGTGFMAGTGLKVGDIVRASTGSVTANNARNFLITGLTNTVVTFVALDGATVTSGSSTTTVVTVTGKKTYVPTTGHVKDYYTFEDFYADLTKSEIYTDCRVGKITITIPASGNVTVAVEVVGLNRTLGTSQVLTSPVVTTTAVLAAITGKILINGTVQTVATSATIVIENGAANTGAVIGQNVGNDVFAGRVKVSGSFVLQFDSTTIQALYAAGTVTSMNVVLTSDSTATAEAVSIMVPRLKLTDDAPDDGEKQIIRTFPFTAEYNGSGGSGVSSEQTIISVQDTTI